MNFIKTTLLFLVLVLISTFMPSNENEMTQQDVTASTRSTDLWDSKECFDQKMETWFVAFNGYQGMGYGMEEANDMAIADVADEYNNCSSSIKVQIASLEEAEQDNL